VTARKPARKKRATKATPYTLRPGRVLVLRACLADMTSFGGFAWPRSGPVEAPDWSPRAGCGNGLHGWLWGSGDIGASSGVHEYTDAVWLVVEVNADALVDLGGKVKFPRGVVVHAGARDEAVAMIAAHAPAGTPIMWCTATAGDHGTATAGDHGTATAGDRGTATAGNGGTATAGDRGTATAGHGGTATAGEYGCICVTWYDERLCVYRKLVAEVDGVTIKPGVAYVVRDGEFAEKEARS